MDKVTRAPLEHLNGDLDGHVRIIDQPPAQLPAIGLETSDKYSQVCIRDAVGDIASESRVRTTPEAMRKYFGTLVRCRVALEVGTHSRWLQAQLTKLGFEVYVPNARKLRAIYQSDPKTGKCDACFLAEVVQLKPSLLCPMRACRLRGSNGEERGRVSRRAEGFGDTRTLARRLP
jgi:transposase